MDPFVKVALVYKLLGEWICLKWQKI